MEKTIELICPKCKSKNTYLLVNVELATKVDSFVLGCPKCKCAFSPRKIKSNPQWLQKDVGDN